MDRLLDATFLAEQQHFWFRGLRRFVAPLLERACRGVTAPRIVDCGCGTGANLRLLSHYGRAYGFDLNARGLALARSAGVRHLARASVTAIPYPDATFDVATSFDVIYSLADEDERTALGEMRRVLVPGGALIVNVAALDLLHGHHSVLSEEVRRYTRPRLRAVLERAGFQVERITYTNASLFPLIAGVRLAQRVTGRADAQLDAEITVPPAPVNGALSAILAIEAAALKIVDMPIGSSLLCLARKRRETPSV